MEQSEQSNKLAGNNDNDNVAKTCKNPPCVRCFACDLDQLKIDRLLESFDDLKTYIAAKKRLDNGKDNIIFELSMELEKLKKDLHKDTIGLVVNDICEVTNDLNNSLKYHQENDSNVIKSKVLISLLSSYKEELEYIVQKYHSLKDNI